MLQRLIYMKGKGMDKREQISSASYGDVTHLAMSC